LLEQFKASERHVCELMAVARSSCRYQIRRDDGQIEERLRELAREHPRFGYRRLHLYLHEEMGVNHKKVQRVYRELGLTVKRTRRKHLRRTPQPRPVLTAPNQEWALDFASDVLPGLAVMLIVTYFADLGRGRAAGLCALVDILVMKLRWMLKGRIGFWFAISLVLLGQTALMVRIHLGYQWMSTYALLPIALIIYLVDECIVFLFTRGIGTGPK
jgi:hypothetical protein